jgi:hypothetical protein
MTKWLTECTTGSTIQPAKAETARPNAVFFTGMALLARIIERRALGPGIEFQNVLSTEHMTA